MTTPIWDEMADRYEQLHTDEPGPINPDCAQGKHHACSGDAWDAEADAPAPCACECHAGPKDEK